MPLSPCRDCGKQVSLEASVCPDCGRRAPAWSTLNQMAVLLICTLVLIALFFVASWG